MSEQSLNVAQAYDEQVGDFVREFALKNFIRIPRVPLYHYTTGDTLIRIIESMELWSTQASCLNDTSELLYAAAEFRRRVSARLSGSHDPRITEFLVCLDAALSDAYSYSVKSPIFVSCFSESRDNLSQWRAYTAGEGGYAIQFDSNKLAECGKPADSGGRPQLVRIEYRPAEHDRMFNEVLHWAENYLLSLQSTGQVSKDACVKFVPTYFWVLGYLAACLKHPKFENEREWRLVYALRDDDWKCMEFRSGQSMLRRHFPLRLARPLPITGVVLGPSRYPKNSSVAVNDMLKKAGYDLSVVKVEITEVPYRVV